MDASHRQEVYIPEDAQVGSIPLWTIPDRLLDRMGVPTRPSSSSSSSSCGAPGPSPEGTWISPVRIRKRTHLAAVSGDPDGGQIPLCSRRRTPAAAAGRDGSPPPVEVPFVTSNRLALEVLQDLLQGTRSPPTGGRTLLPRVSAPPLHQDAVIAYRGNIFLSIRRSHGRGRGGGGPRVAPPTPALGPVSTVPDSPPAAVKSTGEPPRTQRPPRPPGGLHLPEDPSAPHPDPGDPSAPPHPDPEDPSAPPHPDPEDPSAPPHPDPEDPAPPHPDPEDPSAPPHPDPEEPAPPHPDPEEPAAPAAPHPDPEDPSPPHPDPEDPSAPPHPDPGEESEGVPSETPGTPTTVHPAASSGPLLRVQDHLVPLHRGGPGPPGQQNYRTCDFEALELDEKIARMKVKLRESEEALRRGCS